ncbi:MAG: serine--tRNA ligase [Chloroflexi bacterium]|nr:serine--tRNA ligase [Chloroflexota bacterium]
MLDITVIREKPEFVKAELLRLQDEQAAGRIDTILELDKARRTLLAQSEAIQQHRNRLNKGVGRLRGDKSLDDAARAQRAGQIVALIAAGDYAAAADVMEGNGSAAPATPVEFQTLLDALAGMGDTVNGYNARIREVDGALQDNLLWLPNLPHESTAYGASDEDNKPWPMEGTLREFDFEPKPHWDLGPALDIIDFERGVKIAGSRGYVLKAWGARLQRALTNLFLDTAFANGYTECYLPFFVKEDMMIGAAQFPKFRDVVYFDPDADVYMLPTAEVAITNLYRDEILDESALTINMVGHTPCFRRERTSAGRDVRGIKRVHQFQKVELYKFTKPEDSYAELEKLIEDAAGILRALKLPFRRLEICTGDLGFSATKKFDLEVWSPGCGEWLEVSSCSNTETFQARRANVRYRPEGGGRPQFVHTLNGSGLAAPRVLIALMETYQRADGSIEIPDVLRPYLGGATEIPAP